MRDSSRQQRRRWRKHRAYKWFRTWDGRRHYDQRIRQRRTRNSKSRTRELTSWREGPSLRFLARDDCSGSGFACCLFCHVYLQGRVPKRYGCNYGTESLFTIVSTVVGTYFGIKTSSDTRDKLQGSIDKAIETANRALAEMAPEAGRRVMRGE